MKLQRCGVIVFVFRLKRSLKITQVSFLRMNTFWCYKDGKKVTTGPLIHSTNYIYCTVCDTLVYIPDNWTFCLTNSVTASSHLKRCIAENTRYGSISGECAKREEFLRVIAMKEEHIWDLKQRIMRYEAEIR